MKIAIIGIGGAGTTAAWLLDGDQEVDIYERNETIGGHANTVQLTVDAVTHDARATRLVRVQRAPHGHARRRNHLGWLEQR